MKTFNTLMVEDFIMTIKYLLPNDGQECDRLYLQHFLYSNFLSPVEQILKNDGVRAKVLDIGVEQLPSFDMSLHKHTQIKPFNAEFVVGNVLDGLTFEDDALILYINESSCKSFQQPKFILQLQNYAMTQGELENIHKEEKNIRFGKNSGELEKW
ncbi:hypothetical protein C2G38_2171387 [Gigaspora rosea]|uniref:Uncharacterized protein n=1 Tax=Gigaspora rosea TaxID=44941 RepID=A0A397VLP0_9GLOM|nr:hypothetical protein C2G38_2171387 [Gigaspora rosea]